MEGATALRQESMRGPSGAAIEERSEGSARNEIGLDVRAANICSEACLRAGARSGPLATISIASRPGALRNQLNARARNFARTNAVDARSNRTRPRDRIALAISEPGTNAKRCAPPSHRSMKQSASRSLRECSARPKVSSCIAKCSPRQAPEVRGRFHLELQCAHRIHAKGKSADGLVQNAAHARRDLMSIALAKPAFRPPGNHLRNARRRPLQAPAARTGRRVKKQPV